MVPDMKDMPRNRRNVSKDVSPGDSRTAGARCVRPGRTENFKVTVLSDLVALHSEITQELADQLVRLSLYAGLYHSPHEDARGMSPGNGTSI